MAVVRIKFNNHFGPSYTPDIVLSGCCNQHRGSELATEAVSELVERRQLLEERPWLIGYLPEAGQSISELTGEIATAFWEGSCADVPPRGFGMKWGTAPNKEKVITSLI